MMQLKWKIVVVSCFVTATIEWFLQGLSRTFGLDTPRKIIIFGVVVAYLTIRMITGKLDFSILLEGIAINLFASRVIPE
jgi:hypothetical protein